MLVQRRRRWVNIKTILVQRLLLLGIVVWALSTQGWNRIVGAVCPRVFSLKQHRVCGVCGCLVLASQADLLTWLLCITESSPHYYDVTCLIHHEWLISIINIRNNDTLCSVMQQSLAFSFGFANIAWSSITLLLLLFRFCNVDYW